MIIYILCILGVMGWITFICILSSRFYCDGKNKKIAEERDKEIKVLKLSMKRLRGKLLFRKKDKKNERKT